MSMRISWLSLAAAALWQSPAAYCGEIAAWWMNDLGPGVLMQDDETGGIRYSLCNSNSTPIFPDDPSQNTLELDQWPPKRNTSLAASGWWDPGTTSYASIFYMDESDDIVNTFLECDWNTGRWMNKGDYVTTNGSPRVASNSGLAVCLLGDTDGYRVFYNDVDGSIQHVMWTNTLNEWIYAGLVSDDEVSANAIAATFPGDTNMTVAIPRDGENMGLARFYADDLWHIESFPTPLTRLGDKSTNATKPSNLQLNETYILNFTLPGWDGRPTALGMSEDSNWVRSIFYIGTDMELHQLGNLDYEWYVFAAPDSSTTEESQRSWPKADDGRLAVASDFSTSAQRIYYFSGGQLVEANGDQGNWAAASALPTSNTTVVSETPEASSSSGSSSNGGLNTGAKAGIGIGVTIGVLAMIGMGVAFFFLRRRQKRLEDAVAAGTEKPSPHPGLTSPSSAAATAWSDHQTSPTGGQPSYTYGVAAAKLLEKELPPHPPPAQELASPEIYEMSADQHPTELIGEGHYREAP